MTAVIYEVGKPYWEIAKRFHAHRDTSTLIGPTAVRDMIRLHAVAESPAVLRRVSSFIARHQRQLPGTLPPNDGPRRA